MNLAEKRRYLLMTFCLHIRCSIEEKQSSIDKCISRVKIALCIVFVVYICVYAPRRVLLCFATSHFCFSVFFLFVHLLFCFRRSVLYNFSNQIKLICSSRRKTMNNWRDKLQTREKVVNGRENKRSVFNFSFGVKNNRNFFSSGRFILFSVWVFCFVFG